MTVSTEPEDAGVYRWIRWGQDIPDGWRVVEAQILCHHHFYGRLVERDDQERKESQ